MDWLLKVTTIWLSIDIVSIATIWFAAVIVPHFWPDWWAQFIIDGNDLDLEW